MKERQARRLRGGVPSWVTTVGGGDRFSCAKDQLPSTTSVTSRSQPRAANDTEGGLRGNLGEFEIAKRTINSSGHPKGSRPEPFCAFPRTEGGGARK